MEYNRGDGNMKNKVQKFSVQGSVIVHSAQVPRCFGVHSGMLQFAKIGSLTFWILRFIQNFRLRGSGFINDQTSPFLLSLRNLINNS